MFIRIDADRKGQEYLDLYPYAEYDKVKGENVYQFWICESDTKYITLKAWLNADLIIIRP